MGAEKDNDIDITYEADMQHSHVITTDKSFNAIEVPATASDLGKFKKKVTKIMKSTGICQKCPNRYKAITQGKECCLEIDD